MKASGIAVQSIYSCGTGIVSKQASQTLPAVDAIVGSAAVILRGE